MRMRSRPHASPNIRNACGLVRHLTTVRPPTTTIITATHHPPPPSLLSRELGTHRREGGQQRGRRGPDGQSGCGALPSPSPSPLRLEDRCLRDLTRYSKARRGGPRTGTKPQLDPEEHVPTTDRCRKRRALRQCHHGPAKPPLSVSPLELEPLSRAFSVTGLGVRRRQKITAPPSRSNKSLVGRREDPQRFRGSTAAPAQTSTVRPCRWPDEVDNQDLAPFRACGTHDSGGREGTPRENKTESKSTRCCLWHHHERLTRTARARPQDLLPRKPTPPAHSALERPI